MSRIKRALISVYDKTGLIPFAQRLALAGIELISTGGTAQALRASGLAVEDVSALTGFPEMLDGRVKTLHPKVHGALLYLRGNAGHEAIIRESGIKPIDLLVVNLYPFERTVADPAVALGEAIENIDIGGPSMLRSAAKNHESVTVVADPADYEEVAQQIETTGVTSTELRRRLAAHVFARTSAYDAAIAVFLTNRFTALAPDAQPGSAAGAGSAPLPTHLNLLVPRVQTLRYGENPHQRAGLYGQFFDYFTQIHGRELSYNNVLDLTAAVKLIAEFGDQLPTLAILKHTNPCGVGQGTQLSDAWEAAFATDKQAPFGGIIAVNQILDLPCAEALADIFSEVIVAPEFAPDALALLQRKKHLRLLKFLKPRRQPACLDLRSVGAESYLLQEPDVEVIRSRDFKVVTQRQPTPDELQSMLFGWRVVKHVKSNAIVFASNGRTLGIGAGQMSRVDASRIAIWKAGEAALSLAGSVVCSDAFFPFPDGLIAAAEAGATAAIQPGGSKRDPEVIAAADKKCLAMVFTGVRHFRH